MIRFTKEIQTVRFQQSTTWYRKFGMIYKKIAMKMLLPEINYIVIYGEVK